MSDDTPLVVHVIYRLDFGGLENGVVNLVNGIPSAQLRQAIICLDGYTEFRNRIKSADVQLIDLKKKEGKDFGAYFRLWRILRELKPDVIHTRNLGTLDAVIPAVLAGVRFRIHGEHGWDMVDLHGENRKYRLLRRLCAPFITRHITVSKHLASFLRDSIGLPSKKIVHICNGVDTKKFMPIGSELSVDRGSELSGSGVLNIGMIGRMAAVKNPGALIDAFQLLGQQLPDGFERIRLVFVGSGPLYPEISQRLVDEGLSENVWLAGERDDINHILRSLDIFVMPSLNEGISNTILEAMATGLPVVATNVGGNPELVVDGVTGYLVKPNDAQEMANRLQSYVENEDLRSVHGAAARARTESEFSLQFMINRYADVYGQLLGRSLIGTEAV